ncbi:MAG: hypothetical protein U1F27_04075 [Turneriella sp.]
MRIAMYCVDSDTGGVNSREIFTVAAVSCGKKISVMAFSSKFSSISLL